MSQDEPSQSGKEIHRIGILQFIPQLEETVWAFMEALETRLGWTPRFEVLDARGKEKQCLPLARQLVKKKCSLLFGCLTPAVKALITASRDLDLPVVFAPVFHPALSGIVADEDRPGSRVTGVAGRLEPELKADTLALLFPDLRAITVIVNGADPLSCWEGDQLVRVFRARGMDVEWNRVGTGFPAPSQEGRVHLLAFSPELEETMDQWIESFYQARAPVVGSSARAGFLGAIMSVFADHGALGKIAGEMAARILQGEDPAAMAIRFPLEASHGFNYYAAGRLGIPISPDLGQHVDIL